MLELQISTPLRFYTKLELQNKNKSYCKGECDFGLLFPRETSVYGALPFSFKIPPTAGVIQGFAFIGTCDPFVSTGIDISVLSLQSIGGELYITYNGSVLDVDIPDCTYGYFIISMTTGENFYSEITEAKEFNPNNGKYSILEWWNNCDLAGIPYSLGYKNKIYTDLLLTNPEYKTEIEYVDEKTGNYRKTFSTLTKEYLAEIIDVPEYLADAYALIPLHTNFVIKCKDLELSSISTTFENEYPNSCFSKVDLKIVVDRVVIGTNCCDNAGLDTCYDHVFDNVDDLASWNSGNRLTAEGTASIGETWLILTGTGNPASVWTFQGGTEWLVENDRIGEGDKIQAGGTDMFSITNGNVVYGAGIMCYPLNAYDDSGEFVIEIQAGTNIFFDIELHQVGVGIIQTFTDIVMTGEPIQEFRFNYSITLGQDFEVYLKNIGWHNGCSYNDTPIFTFSS